MIEIKNVSYAYRVSDTEGRPILRPAVKDLNLKIHSGEFLVLTGSSGCGKTTVCRLINGLIPHYFEGEKQGEVLIDGTDVAVQPIYETARLIGSVFQNPRSQFFNLDTTSELAFAAENQGRDPEIIRRDIARASDLLELSPLLGRSMFNLSGGEKQKIACGTVAVADPSIIVLDEPSSNLDMDGIEELRKTLALWKSQGKTVIIAEHRLFFLRELADRVVLFEDGVITRQFTSEQFIGLTASETSSLGIRSVTLPVLPAHENSTAKKLRVITLEGIEFTYSDKLHGIRIPSLELPQNEIIAIIGHNGAGKSTFARTLSGKRDCARQLYCGQYEHFKNERFHYAEMNVKELHHTKRKPLQFSSPNRMEVAAVLYFLSNGVKLHFYSLGTIFEENMRVSRGVRVSGGDLKMLRILKH